MTRALLACALLLACAHGAAAQNQSQESGPNVASSTSSTGVVTITGQRRISGPGSGLDVEGPSGATGTGSIGILVEDDVVASPVTNGSAGNPGGWGPSYIGADSKSQATLILESHNATTAGCPVSVPQGACADSVLSLRRSRGTGHGSEGQTRQNDYLGTIMFQGWTGTAGQSWNNGYGQAMGLECYTSENWDSTHRGTRCSFYSTPNNTTGTAQNASCSVTPGSPWSCCTGLGTGNCTTVPVEVWGTSETGQFDVKGQTIFSNTLFQAATGVNANLDQLSYQDNFSSQRFEYVTEGAFASGDHARWLSAVPQRITISNSTTPATAMTIPLAGVGAVAAGACTTGCAFTIRVHANAVCTTTGVSCTIAGQTVEASRLVNCDNRNGTAHCATHVQAGGTDASSWWADTLTVQAGAEPISVSASSSDALIKVANPEANNSVYTWVVGAEILSSGL